MSIIEIDIFYRELLKAEKQLEIDKRQKWDRWPVFVLMLAGSTAAHAEYLEPVEPDKHWGSDDMRPRFACHPEILKAALDKLSPDRLDPHEHMGYGIFQLHSCGPKVSDQGLTLCGWHVFKKDAIDA